MMEYSQQNVEELQQKMKRFEKLMKSMESMESKMDAILTQVITMNKFAPGNEGAQQAKEHFERLQKLPDEDG